MVRGSIILSTVAEVQGNPNRIKDGLKEDKPPNKGQANVLKQNNLSTRDEMGGVLYRAVSL